jgi:hypothetical protein
MFEAACNVFFVHPPFTTVAHGSTAVRNNECAGRAPATGNKVSGRASSLMPVSLSASSVHKAAGQRREMHHRFREFSSSIRERSGKVEGNRVKAFSKVLPEVVA